MLCRLRPIIFASILIKINRESVFGSEEREREVDNLVVNTGIPVAGLIKGNAAKTLKMKFDKHGISLLRPGTAASERPDLFRSTYASSSRPQSGKVDSSAMTSKVCVKRERGRGREGENESERASE